MITNKENWENDNVFTLENAQNYILAQRAENTVKKTEYDLNVWKRFFRNKGEEREIEDIPAEELNILICRFMMEIKKKDGSAYEAATLSCFQRSLQRYLNDKNFNINILKDQEFQKSREVLLSKKKQLVVLNKPKVIAPKLRENLPILKNCFIPVNLAIKTLKLYSAQFGCY